MDDEPVLDIAIKYYYYMGLQQSEIMLFLLQHNINISSATLKRRLRRLNLYRRKNYSSLETVMGFLEGQILTSNRLHGYKWMYRKCLHSGITAKQETIRYLLNIIDPIGVSLRKRKKLHRRQYFNKGPNYLWHVDGYDKLKPYGFCISGCIDGFSRKILWLKTAHTNNDPKVISGYYIETVKKISAIPRTVRTDMGTENIYIEDMHIYLHETAENGWRDGDNGLPPFLYGSSHSNQRIEAWWSILRKHSSQFWMNLFTELKDGGLFNGTFLDKSILQYCFMDIIQEELNTVMLEWNTHIVRKSRHSICPAGRPDVLYNFPEICGSVNYETMVQPQYIENCEEECVYLNYPCSDEDVFNLCEIIVTEMGLYKTTDVYDAVNLYTALRNEILSLL